MDVHDYMRRLEELLAATGIIIEERDEARRERDEARREVCELTLPCAGHTATCAGSQRGYAKGRGWDCYREETT